LEAGIWKSRPLASRAFNGVCLADGRQAAIGPGVLTTDDTRENILNDVFDSGALL
jgi:hypothetical protein